MVLGSVPVAANHSNSTMPSLSTEDAQLVNKFHHFMNQRYSTWKN